MSLEGDLVLEQVLTQALELQNLYRINRKEGERQISNAVHLMVVSKGYVVPARRVLAGLSGEDMLSPKTEGKLGDSEREQLLKIGFKEVRAADQEFDEAWERYLDTCSKFGTTPSSGTPTASAVRAFWIAP